MPSQRELGDAVVGVLGVAPGSGFFVAPDHVLTCAHVVGERETVGIYHPEIREKIKGDLLECKVVEGAVERAPDRDFALVRIDDPALSRRPLALGVLDAAAIGAVKFLDFAARGYPYGWDPEGQDPAKHMRPLTGEVSMVDAIPHRLHAKQFSTAEPTKPTGFSGGPIVVDQDVVALVGKYQYKLTNVPTGGEFDGWPVGPVLENEACKQIFGDRHRRRAAFRREAMSEIERLLALNPTVLEHAVQALAVSSVNDADKAALTAAAVARLPAEELIAAFCAPRMREDPDAFGIVSDVLAYGLPLCHEFFRAFWWLDSAKCECATAEAATHLYLEILLSAAEQRRAVFEPGEEITGRGLIHLCFEEEGRPGALCVFGMGRDDLLNLIVDHIASRERVARSVPSVRGALRAIASSTQVDRMSYSLVVDGPSAEGDRLALLDYVAAQFLHKDTGVRLLRVIPLSSDPDLEEDEVAMLSKLRTFLRG